MEDLTDVLEKHKEEYGIDAKIELLHRPPTRLENDHASIYKKNGKYRIEIISKAVKPILFHEFLHVVLEETDRFIDFNFKNENNRKYFFELKCLFDDYLIETEVKRKWGYKQKSFFKRMRLDDNTALACLNYGKKVLAPTEIFMELLSLRNICANVYPALQWAPAARVMKDALKSPRFDGVVKVCKEYDFASTDKDRYRKGIRAIHKALTQSCLDFKKNKYTPCPKKPAMKELINGFNEAFLMFA